MKVIPKRTIEAVRFQNDIGEVLSSYLNLQRAGSNFRCLCPFHKEKTPSFHVNSQRQIFHCFGCGVGGDVFKFLMQYEGVDFAMAVKMLAERVGIPIDLEEGDGDASDKSLLLKVHAELSQFYRRCLEQMSSAERARRYLEERDLGGEIADEFLIGYAPDRWDSCIRWGREHKHGTEALEKCGLILKSSRPDAATDYYDRFRNRIMFPITDEQSRVIGFSGRTLDKDPKAAKYVNSPETPLFSKSRILYALDKARRHIVESREAIVCEGQIDVIRCHQAGFPTAVACQGTAFTEDHARILNRYADSVVIVFDPDKAGQDAAVRAAATFMAAGLAVGVASLPPGEDPDSYVRKEGAEGFRSVLGRAMSAVGFQIDSLSQRENVRSEVGVMRVARAVLATISRSPNAVQRAKLVQEAAHRLGLPASALQDDLRHVLRRAHRADPPDEGESRQSPSHPPEEVALCEHMANVTDHPELADLVRAYLPLDLLADTVCRKIVESSLASLEHGRPMQEVIREMGDPDGELQRLSAQVQMAPSKATGNEFTRADAVKDSILRIWQRKLRAERGGLEDGDPMRRQLTLDLKNLGRWETGAPVIECHMVE